VEIERANSLRTRLMLLVGYQDGNCGMWGAGAANWAPWWESASGSKHNDLLDDWFTALACQQPAEALSIAQQATEQWKRDMLTWIAHEEAMMVRHQQKPTVGWVARIAAKLGTITQQEG
jgi:hypothetical protein